MGQGRNPGSKNRVTETVMNTWLVALADYNSLPKLKSDLDSMSPFNRRKTLEGIHKYFFSTLNKNENDNKNEHTGKIEVEIELISSIPKFQTADEVDQEEKALGEQDERPGKLLQLLESQFTTIDVSSETQ